MLVDLLAPVSIPEVSIRATHQEILPVMEEVEQLVLSEEQEEVDEPVVQEEVGMVGMVLLVLRGEPAEVEVQYMLDD